MARRNTYKYTVLGRCHLSLWVHSEEIDTAGPHLFLDKGDILPDSILGISIPVWQEHSELREHPNF